MRHSESTPGAPAYTCTPDEARIIARNDTALMASLCDGIIGDDFQVPLRDVVEALVDGNEALEYMTKKDICPSKLPHKYGRAFRELLRISALVAEIYNPKFEDEAEAIYNQAKQT